MTEGPPMPKPGPPRPRPPAAAPPEAGDSAELSASTETGDVAAAGDPRVEAVLADLEQLSELPVTDHLAVYERVHAKLREVLQTAGQDMPPPPSSPPGPGAP